MDIVIGVPGHVEVEDVADALDIEPACGNVGGDEDVDVARLEAFELAQPLGLLHVTMDLPCLEAAAREALGEIAHRRLAVREDQRRAHVVGLEQLAQRVPLAARGRLDDCLLDREIGRRGTRNLDLLGVREEFVGELLDRRGHRRREEQRLAVGRQLGADFLDIGDEPHVEHAIGLVDHEQRAAGQQYLAALEQIHQPARGRDQHVDALFERGDLLRHVNTANQKGHVKLMIFTVFIKILGNLSGKLTGRLKDQRTRHARTAASMGEDIDHRQHEAGGLAGARLRNADQIPHHQDGGDRLRLDRRRFAIPRLRNSAEQLVRKAEIGKAHK